MNLKNMLKNKKVKTYTNSITLTCNSGLSGNTLNTANGTYTTAPCTNTIIGGTSTATIWTNGQISFGNTTGNSYITSTTINFQKITLLGREFNLSLYSDSLQLLTLINMHGIAYYGALKDTLQGNLSMLNFTEDIKQFLEAELKAFKRNEKIKKTLREDDSA